MFMPNEEHDWLDARLSARDYIPDAGFTAAVMGRVPKRSAAAVATTRNVILLFAGLISLVLLTIQASSLAAHINRLNSIPVSGATLLHFLQLIQQPLALPILSLSLVVLTLSAMPLLRRWV
jgi:hypothetical protein